MSVRFATFNVENLMERFDFSFHRSRDQSDQERARVIAHADDARQMAALAIADCRADIVCLQEVENQRTLDAFEQDYLNDLTGLSYPQRVLIEGNDGRGIDVALMARETSSAGEPIKIVNVRSHRKKTYGKMGLLTEDLKKMGLEDDDRVFRRDCLEVDLRIGGKMMSVFVCHFKSMGTSEPDVNGRDYTMPVRIAEARAVRQIIMQKFGSHRAADMRWLICGDLNDYTERLAVEGNKNDGYAFDYINEPTSGVEPLTVEGFAHDLLKRRARDERWTLYYASGPVEDPARSDRPRIRQLVQLDYLLASPALAESNKDAVPDVIRSGQPFRTIFPEGQEVERYPRTGWDRPKASDHCPVAVTLTMG